MGVTTQTAQLPDYAKPYVQDMLAQTQAYTDVNANPYQQYTGERVAGFSGLQNEAFRGAGEMQPSAYTDQGAGIAGLASNQALAAGQNFQPGRFANQFNAPAQYQSGQFSAQQAYAPALNTYQMYAPGQVGFERAGAERIGAPNVQDLRMQSASPVYAERVGTPGMQAASPVYAERVGTSGMQAATTGYNPQLHQYQMQAPSDRVTSDSFTRPGSAEAYMSPYMQNVVDVQKREAARQSAIQGTQQQAQATHAKTITAYCMRVQ